VEYSYDVTDPHVSALGASEPGAHDVGTHQDLFIRELVRHEREVSRRIGDPDELRLTAVYRVAELPTPHRLSATLRAVTIEARLTLSARRDATRDDALANLVPGNGVTERGDDSDRLVADNAAGRYRIFTLQNVNVGSADGRGCDAKQRVGGTDSGNRSVLELDLSRFDEDNSFHRRPIPRTRQLSPGGECQHGRSLLWVMPSPLICSRAIFKTSASKSLLERFAQTFFRRRVRSFRRHSSLVSRLSESRSSEFETAAARARINLSVIDILPHLAAEAWA
jgi:hypothetical protein